jgi:hypothetical protein
MMPPNGADFPRSAVVTVPGESGTYTFTIQLPILGTPQLYPFDSYTLLLGLVVSVTLIDLILAFVMLVLLLALSIRAARYFYVQSRLRRRG